MNTSHEVVLLKEEIQRLGKQNADGKWSVSFGTLVRDDRCSNIFEALVGTLRSAKRAKVISYESEMLLQGRNDDEQIVLLQA